MLKERIWRLATAADQAPTGIVLRIVGKENLHKRCVFRLSLEGTLDSVLLD